MKCKHLKNKNVTQRVEEDSDGFHIEGCCGGGCYVIMNIIYCPFCGKKLKTSQKDDKTNQKEVRKQ